MKKYTLTALLGGLLLVPGSIIADCTSIGDGEWGEAGTWDCGREPASTETVTISAGHEVNVDGNYGEYENMYIKIYGTLSFGNGDKLDLDETSQVDVFDDGEISGGNSGTKLYVGAEQWSGSDDPVEGPSFITDAGITEGAVLPVEFTSFTSETSVGEVKLLWTTGTEKNNDYFEIQRSANGLDFEAIGNESGAGTTSETSFYEFVDPEPIIGFAYYRLKQVDYDGTTDYSATIGVELSENADGSCTIKIMPNPCVPSCDIQYTACESTQTNLDLQVYDTSGRLIHSYLNASALNTGGTFKVNSGDYSQPGIYIVKAGDASERMVIK